MYSFRLISEKRTALLKGYPYDQRDKCITAIRALYDTVRKEHHYRFQTVKGKFYFQVTDNTHTVIAVSPLYRTMAGMAYGINKLKYNVAISVIQDQQPAPA